MDFAAAQLAKFGWSEGQGLGKKNDGIAKSIKVNTQKDTKGIGSTTDTWAFQWWDHAFNKAASNIVIESDSDQEIRVKKSKEIKRTDYLKKVSKTSDFVSTEELVAEDYTSKITEEELLKRCEGRTGDKRGRIKLDKEERKAKKRRKEEKREKKEQRKREKGEKKKHKKSN